MSQTKPAEFGRWRSMLWPIHAFELKKFLPMFFLFFFINFNYTILRDTKDTLIVTSAGAETITFLKFWGVVPGAVVFMLLFTKLSNVFSRERLFMGLMASFGIFFGLFALFLYPNREAISPIALTDWMSQSLPQGLQGMVGMVRHWPHRSFTSCQNCGVQLPFPCSSGDLRTRLQKWPSRNASTPFLALAQTSPCTPQAI